MYAKHHGLRRLSEGFRSARSVNFDSLLQYAENLRMNLGLPFSPQIDYCSRLVLSPKSGGWWRLMEVIRSGT